MSAFDALKYRHVLTSYFHYSKELDTVYILTKGDNIDFNDRSLYYTDQLWIKREDVIGTVRG